MSYTVNSQTYINNISEALAFFASRIELGSAVNMTDVNKLAEGFYGDFLNRLFGWKLKNANIEKSNMPGIDLCYNAGNIIVQVSSSYDHGKIQESLDKIEKSSHPSGHFYFVAITKKKKDYKIPFAVPDKVIFDENNDIFDHTTLLKHSEDAGIDKLRDLSILVDKYFKRTVVGESLPKGQCLTRMPEYTTTKEIICRDKELEDITDKLKRGENILLMSGFGGIGKTALARLVFHTVKEHYDEVAWIPYNRCLKDSMLAAIQLFEDVNDPEDRWNAILNLKNNGKSKLFVIDNADRDEKAGQSPQDDRDLNALSGWPNTTVIVTSRLEVLAPYSPHLIDFLSPDACVELFYQYYPNDPEQKQKAAVEKLVELAKKHTLTVELFAKGAGREYDLSAYYNKLQKSFASASLKVRVSHNDEMNTIVGHLKILFDMKRRSRKEKRILWDFAVLPTDAVLTSDEAEQWFGHDANVLDQLAQDGWLSWTKEHYTMHPLVKDILLLDKVSKRTAKKFLAFTAKHSNGYFPDGEVYTETLRKLELAESVVTAVCHKETVQLAHILHNMGVAYWRVGQFQKAKERFEHAIRISEAKLGEDHPSTATTYNNIASVYQAMGDLPKALEFFEKAKAIREAKLGKDHPDTAATYNNIANVYQAMGDLPKALEFFEKALPIVKAKLGEDHPHTASTYNNIALVYQAMGDLPKALEFYEKALPIFEAKLGEDHPNTATTYCGIALVYQAMGDLPKALEFYEKALPIVKAKLGEDHPNTAATYNNIAGVYYAMGDLPKALEFYEKVLPIFETKLGEDHPDTATTYNNIALVYDAMGDLPKALEFFEKAKAIREAKLGKDHPDTATTYHNMGTLYYEQKDYSTAKAYLLKALKIRLIKLGAGHPYTQDTLGWLSLCHEAAHGSEEGFIPWLMEQLNEEARQILAAWEESNV